MSSQAFLWVCLLLAVIFIVSFLWGRKGKSPSQLKLRSALGQGGKTKMPATKSSQSAKPHFQSPPQQDSPDQFSKSLNVMFVYNGHTFDAYEILGIPAGSSVSSAKQAFDTQTAKADGEQKNFLGAAFAAIKLSKEK